MALVVDQTWAGVGRARICRTCNYFRIGRVGENKFSKKGEKRAPVVVCANFALLDPPDQ